jgi:hypothetical protein
MSRHELVAACDADDHAAIRRLGWRDVHEALNTWWKPKQGCTLTQLTWFAKLLGDEDPAQIVEALEALCGEWQPSPAAVRGYLNGKRADGARVDVGRARDLSGTEDALREVAAALQSGERPCACAVHSARWRCGAKSRPGGSWVLRCATCDGLEPGQVYAAEDAGLLGEVAS